MKNKSLLAQRISTINQKLIKQNSNFRLKLERREHHYTVHLYEDGIHCDALKTGNIQEVYHHLGGWSACLYYIK